MKRIIITILSIIMLLQPISFSVSPTTVNAAKNDTSHGMGQGLNPKNITAESAIVMDINSGAILYEKNMDDKHYPASITKIMTTLLCLENSSLTDKVLFSAHAVNSIEPGSSHISIVPNEIMPMEDCLYGIMLMSANEACNGVAEHVAGSIPAFVDMMNAKAKSLGCKNTHFNNPNGLFDEKHYTTAYDMALIARECFKNPTFMQIDSTTYYEIGPTNKTDETRKFYNRNKLLPGLSHGYAYCTGGKTGYVDEGGDTYVGSAEKDGMRLIVVLFRSTEDGRFDDAEALFEWGFRSFSHYALSSIASAANFTGTNFLKSASSLSGSYSFGFTTSYITAPTGADLKNVTMTSDSGTGNFDALSSISAPVTFMLGDHTVGTSTLQLNTGISSAGTS